MDYILRHENKVVCNVPIKDVTQGIRYEREKKAAKRNFKEPHLREPSDFNKILLSVLKHPNVASKAKAYKHYDTSVMGTQLLKLAMPMLGS